MTVSLGITIAFCCECSWSAILYGSKCVRKARDVTYPVAENCLQYHSNLFASFLFLPPFLLGRQGHVYLGRGHVSCPGYENTFELTAGCWQSVKCLIVAFVMPAGTSVQGLQQMSSRQLSQKATARIWGQQKQLRLETSSSCTESSLICGRLNTEASLSMLKSDDAQ